MPCPKCGHSNPAGRLRCQSCESVISSEGDVTATGIGTSAGWTRPVAAGPQGPPGALSEGTLIAGRYEILKLLGQGGMGAVYTARDTELDRVVALKVIRSEFAGDARSLQRFKQELLLARQVTHRNVVRIFDLGTHEGMKFITMEFVEGRDLAAVMEERRFSPGESARIVRQICRALEAAHAEGVVHRDLKPQNIVIDPSGKALVMDFGLARSATMPGLTQTGAVLGTPAYMSPEQAKGAAVDERSDLFSLGVIFFELLTGRTPYEADTVWGMLLKRTQEPAPPVSSIAPDTPPELAAIVAKCLEIDPARRPQSATELALELDLWLRDTPLTQALDRRESVAPPQPAPAAAARPRGRWLIPAAAAGVLGVAALLGWMLLRPAKSPAPAKAETVVVADIDNQTGDAVFDGTLEPVLRLALEGAGFINAYNRSTLPARVDAPAGKFDENAALRAAISQGMGIVVSGSLRRSGADYVLAGKAVRAVTGAVLAKTEIPAGGKDQVLPAVSRLAARMRRALGDDASEESLRFAADTLTATSLEAVHEYAIAMDALSNAHYDEARQRFTNATRLDPKFGLAYAGMASASRSLGDDADADKYIRLAYANIDSMTERERYRTRGLFFVLSGDQQKCVEEYRALTARYASDVGAHNNLGVCYSYLRNIPGAIEEMTKAREILPRRPVYQFNLALYRVYAGDFGTAEKEVRAARELNPKFVKGYLTLAYAQLGLGKLQDAAKTYEAMAAINPRGASLAQSALADLAIYEGRFRAAIDRLQPAAREDSAAGRPDEAADKLEALAFAQLALNQKPAALASLHQALATGNSAKARFLGGRLLADAGDLSTVRQLAANLGSESRPEPQSYGKLLLADAALREGRAADAVTLATQAVGLLDTWIARFDLGRAFLAASALPQADSEFDRCIRRRGEAMELFMDDGPTYGYFPAVYDYLGRVREGMKSSGFLESYRKYVEIRGAAGEDPRVAALRIKLGGK